MPYPDFIFLFCIQILAAPTIASPRLSRSENRSHQEESEKELSSVFVRSMSIDTSQCQERVISPILPKLRSVSQSPPRRTVMKRKSVGFVAPPDSEIESQPMFSNSTVSLTSLCLNEEIFDEELPEFLPTPALKRAVKE